MLLFDLVVIGGGAAGVFAAVNAAAQFPDKKILIIEKSNKLLAKVKVSGGGRCNVTHACYDNRELIRNYPRGYKELLGAFSRFSPMETALWFSQRGVDLKTEDDGRMFPVTNSSQTIINCLLNEAQAYGISIWQSCELSKIMTQENGFVLSLKDQQEIACKKLLIATGGYAKAENYKWIEKLGHSIIPPVPSLFTFNILKNPITELMGVSLNKVRIKILPLKIEEEGALLITHWGFSGPAVLKLSSFAARELYDLNYKYTLIINWLPQFTEMDLRDYINKMRISQGNNKVVNRQGFDFPARLWAFLVSKSAIKDDSRWADINNKQANKLVENLIRDEYPAQGKTTFKEEFVTCGGVSLKEIDFKTMQSKICNNLYFAGEILDIDGITGGFNFQAAWTTAYIAASNMFEK
jgi:predicted Rossmann fold flavoprotein